MEEAAAGLRPTIAFPTWVKVSDPATATIINVSGVRERHRHTINNVIALAIKVMRSAPPRWVNQVKNWLARGVRIAMT